MVEIAKIKKEIQEAKRIVFLGGAGVSTASGIPDFRSPQGLYNVRSKYGVPYEVMLSHSYWERHPDLFYDFYWSTMVNLKAKPNKAHLALANFEAKGHHIAVLTQNIDGLHSEAGSKRVYELHGSVKRYSCVDCNRHFKLEELQAKGIPHCPECGGIIKPDVTLYEEAREEEVLLSAINEVRFANFMIVGGTSLNVYPVAGLVDYFSGGKSLIINKEPTAKDYYFDYVIHDDIGKVLEELLG